MSMPPTTPGRRPFALAGLGATLALGLAPARRAAARIAPSQPMTLRIAGPAGGTGGLALLGEAYMRAHPGASVRVLPASGNAEGIRAVTERRADLAVSHRAPTLAERERALLTTIPFSRTPFVIAVHRDLGLDRITTRELAALYREQAFRLRGGLRAHAVLQVADAMETELLRSFSPAVAAAFDRAAARGDLLEAANDAHCADLIEGTLGAFGPSTLALIESSQRPLQALTIEGFPAPTPEHATSGAYPWSKPLLLVHAGQASPALHSFVDFASSAAARRLLSSAGHCESELMTSGPETLRPDRSAARR